MPGGWLPSATCVKNCWSSRRIRPGDRPFLELYTTGSLDIFGRESTVDLNKPYVVFDIHGLGEQLKPAGSLVITDTILNRVTLNWKRGKRTHVFIDEFHVMFENEQSGIFFNSAWRQFRKRGAYPTAITQNVEYLLIPSRPAPCSLTRSLSSC